MVLENSSSDDFDDNSSPPSDYDTYTSDPLNIQYTSYFWQSKKYTDEMIANRIGAVQHILRRPITQDEASFTTYWTAKMLSIQSLATPAGILGGISMAYRTRATYRFPFYSPNLQTLMPHDYYPHPRFPLLRGIYARIAWHSVRASLYGYGCYAGAVIFFTSYAVSTCTFGAASDPRGEAIREAAANPKTAIVPLTFSHRGEEQKKQKQDLKRGQQRQSKYEDDNAADTREETFASSNDAVSQEMQSDSPMDGNPYSPSTTEPYNSPQARVNKPQPIPVRYTPQPISTSPSPSPSPPQSTSGGSAWDRIRQQSAGGPSKPAAWTKPESPSPEERGSYDTYAAKGNEEDIQTQRGRAQKEFDERIEQERRGGEFNADKEGFKRW